MPERGRRLNHAFDDLRRLEFIVTKNCPGRCRHCSVVTPPGYSDRSFVCLDGVLEATRFLLDRHPVTSVMAFGGEPLLFPDVTARILALCAEAKVAERQLITSGFFSQNESLVDSTARVIVEAGVTEILLSVDAFHQEHIRLEDVERFLLAVLGQGFGNLALHPSWVVSEDADNEYNRETRRIVEKLADHGVRVSAGNRILLSGKAKANLAHYYDTDRSAFARPCGAIEHTNAIDRIEILRFLPNGNVNLCRGVVVGNVCDRSMSEIVETYDPIADEALSTLLESGVLALYDQVRQQDGGIDLEAYHNPCDLCAACLESLNSSERTI